MEIVTRWTMVEGKNEKHKLVQLRCIRGKNAAHWFAGPEEDLLEGGE